MNVTEFLTNEQLRQFQSDGYLVLKDFFTETEAVSLKERALELLAEFNLDSHPKTTFSTGQKKEHIGDEYFLNSGDQIRFFFEEDAFDQEGKLKVEKARSINKIGHGLHLKDDLFHKFTRKNELKGIAKSLGFIRPFCLQSMVICKQPKIGGAVPPHQDSTFLYTNPPSAVGFWFALEDCTPENGCMWFAPKSHKEFPIHKRFIRDSTSGTRFTDLAAVDQEKLENVQFKCEPTPIGTLVLIHGAVLHKSECNKSDKSRFIYTFHMIEGEFEYPNDNWLQQTTQNPFSDYYAL